MLDGRECWWYADYLDGFFFSLNLEGARSLALLVLHLLLHRLHLSCALLLQALPCTVPHLDKTPKGIKKEKTKKKKKMLQAEYWLCCRALPRP